MNIRLVTRQDIDHQLWDACIDNTTNGLVYAKIDFLDLMSDQWDAIVIDNYRAIMPIPFRKKWGIRYVYQVPFIQQLGLIGTYDDTELLECLNLMQETFRYGGYAFNFLNTTGVATVAKNYVLDLTPDYQTIAKGYRNDHRRNLQWDRIRQLEYRKTEAVVETIHLYRELYHHKFLHVPRQSFEHLIRFAQRRPAQAIVREARENGKLSSAILALKDNKRLYTLVSATTEQGKKTAANRFLLDRLIREFAGNDLLLDFEG
ncbi:MAG: hypothetical protein ACOVOS_08740, partial [Chitinophagaceae bacterium]